MSNSVPARPRPRILNINLPFWESLQQHRLMLPRCTHCESPFWPPAPHCPDCWSEAIEWAPVSGRGKVNAWTIYHQSFHEAFDDQVPFNVVEVELIEGPRLQANCIDIDNDDIEIGLEVEAAYIEVDAGLTLLQFRPVLRPELGR